MDAVHEWTARDISRNGQTAKLGVTTLRVRVPHASAGQAMGAPGN